MSLLTNFTVQDELFMRMALDQARLAGRMGEVPVGAVIVRNERPLVLAHNLREASQDPLGHAELLAIRAAAQALGNWRLEGCTLYVTLEPCPMCTGAIINAHIDTVVYGCDDQRAGCCGTAADLFALPYSHRPLVYRGCREEECRALLQTFFRGLREK